MQSIPIFKLRNILFVPIQIELTDERVEDLNKSILKKIETTGVNGLIIDVSGVEVIDSFFARSLITIGRGARYLGCETVVVGVNPDVALTLTEMGLEWSGIKTSLDVESAMDILEKRKR